MGTIALTGVTGHLGNRVRELLPDDGRQLVLLARSPGKVVAGPRDEVRRCDFADPEGAARALSGVDTLLMVSASEAADRLDQHRAFVGAAALAGVSHIVYTSFQGAAADCTFTLGRDHWATEQAIREAGLEFTFLRDSFYADFLPLMAQDGVIRGPAGDGRVAAVAREDVAAVAAVVLVDPIAHADAAYDLTGPEALTLAAAAALIEEVTGRPTRYLDETLEEAYDSRASYGAPDWQVDAWVSTYTAIAAGEVATVSDAVPRITGRPATSLRDLLAPAVTGDASPG
ncbi:NAD(P)H-binding protein [Pedococcus bigeumensis]|uniref:SDR family NAD(P)-dependent oxidoreductase n=1 Tax=Pedococcus bigeumensis TaxID=433644 RepID=A0A502D632_9MICO|nr:NAD(P)H-binding protein [Pedococcus bigeumensis]TPG19546.1 SDR family NAD(P)-dependent oxidoreductase [Pedococcus bigeumensis]